MDRVAIVGVGQTKHEARKKEYSFSEMVYGAVKMALEDAGIGIDGIDNVITTSNDFWDGRTISSMATGDMSGGPGRNDSCVEGDGTFGAFYGSMPDTFRFLWDDLGHGLHQGIEKRFALDNQRGL